MTPSQPSSGTPRPVERFKPTGGQMLGYTGIAAAVIAVGYVALSVHSVTGLRIALGAVFLGVVTWVTQVRPRATAYPSHLVLKNSVRDAYVPLALIDEVSVTQTLNVWVGDVRYLCIGIGQSLREDIRARRRRQDISGGSRMTQLTLMAERASTDERAMSYQTFVVNRLTELVEQAKKEPRADDDGPRYVVAWPEVGALVLSGLAFALSFLFWS